jgi:hypothetical protein
MVSHKGYTGRSTEHSLNSRGIRTANNVYEADGLHFKGLKQTRAEIEQLIRGFKNSDARDQALNFLNSQKKRPLYATKDVVVWGYDNIEDYYGNTWKNIAVYDKSYEFIVGTKAVNILPHMTKKNFSFLNELAGVSEWNIVRNPFVASSSTWAPAVSTLGIKIKADDFNDLNMYSESINMALKPMFKISRKQLNRRV